MADTEQLAQLRQLLANRFSDGELRDLCFDLGVDYEGLPGAGKADKARELVAYMERRGQLTDLVRVGRHSRPDVPWPEIGAVQAPQSIPGIMIGQDPRAPWHEKTLIARQRLSKDFGVVIQRFSRLPDSQEQYNSDKQSWRGSISIKETSPESEWVITLTGDETVDRPIYARMSAKPPIRTQNYRISILASRLVDDTIKLTIQENAEHWPKLERLWEKLWAELERRGYKEVPALTLVTSAAEDKSAKATWTETYVVPWEVAILPVGLADATDFFVRGWDFVVPPFESKDGIQLKLDNAVMAITNIHRVTARDTEGRVIITLNAMRRNPDSETWDLGSAIPAIQFILEPLGRETQVKVVLLEQGAGQFLCVVLDKLISVYPRSERAIQQLISSVADYCSLSKNRADPSLPDVGLQTEATENGDPMTGNAHRTSTHSALPDYKRKALEQRRADLLEEYEAISVQLRRTLSAGDEVKLKRQLQHLEEQIAGVEEELGQAPTPPASQSSPQGAKAPPGAALQPDRLYGAGNRWAVLVGANVYEDAYHFGPLSVCVVDVEATRAQLIAGGFDPARIRLLTDNTDEKPTRANILATLKSVADATEPDDLLLFYYSGHGDEASGESYLVGRDGRRLVLGDTAVPVTRVKQIMDAAPARAKVILLDACHSGANIGQKGPKPMTPEFIQRVFEQAEGLAILASCKQGQFSYEWDRQKGSVFTHYLLDALGGAADRDEKGFVTVQDASRHVTDGVKLWASQQNVSQTPTLQYTAAGDIILTRYSANMAIGLFVPR